MTLVVCTLWQTSPKRCELVLHAGRPAVRPNLLRSVFAILQKMHQGSRHHSTIYLLGRSLLPSDISGVLCVCFSIGLILAHLVLLSLVLGTALPKLFDGQWGLLYTNDVVQPLATLSNNLTFNNALVIGAWGVFGLAVYFVFEFVFGFLKDWREEETDIQLAGNRIIHHPARGSFVATMLWRMSVLIVGLAALIAVQPLLRHLLANDTQLVTGNLSLFAAAHKLLFEIVGWALAAHCVVVFWRLFLMRTRLFGDPEIT